MPQRRHTTYAVWACALALVAAGAFTPPSEAQALPTAPEQQLAPPQAFGSVTTTVGASVVSVEPQTPAIPSDGAFAYTVRARLERPSSSIQVRLKVLNPSGKLMIQQTRIQNQADTGTVVTSFARDMSDLQLAPGAYPVQFEVRIAQAGEIAEKIIETDLLVYDAERSPLPFAICARVSGQPLADPQGKFVADPALFTRARDDVNRLAAWVLTVPTAHITLAVSPLLLSEWDRISSGYELVGPEGSTQVGAEQPVPLSYAATLELLRQAIRTGRLELTTQGYADPDLSALATHGMVQDVDAQYAQGTSASYSSVEITASTGTIPAGGCLPPEAGATLARQGIDYVVTEQSCVRFKGMKAAPGIYRAEGLPLRVLVADSELSLLAGAGDSAGQIRRAFERAAAQGGRGPLIVSCFVGPGETTADALIATAEGLAAQPWLRQRLAREIAARLPASTATLDAGPETAPAPKGYWAGVKSARAWARALAAALGPQAAASRTAENDSLIAQCSAWAGAKGGWELADRGRTFAETALRTSKDVLSAVSLSVEPVTLAGSTGEVPIIIVNGGEVPLVVDVISTTSKGLDVEGEQSQRLELSPQDNFIKLPVSMPDALRGRLTVTVSSADVVLDRETVDVRASYLDRLVIIAGVILLLGGMLVFIIRRVRTVESDEDAR